MAGSILKARYRFNVGLAPAAGGYVNDRAIPAAGTSLIANFVVPPDMTQAQAATLLTGVGGELISFGNIDVVAGTRNIPCSNFGNFKPRKLKFIRANGNSVSVVLPNRANVITAAAAGRVAMNALTAANPVVCIQLIGERYANIFDELVAAGRAASVAAPPSRAAGAAGKGLRYSGLMTAYLSDAPPGTATIAKFSMATENAGAAGITGAPAIIGAAGVASLGTITRGALCPPAAGRVPRYYEVTFLTTGDVAGSTVPQKTKIPVASNAAATILTTGQALAALPAAACIAYQGESFSRLHLLPGV